MWVFLFLFFLPPSKLSRLDKKKKRISFDRYQDTIRNPSVMDFIDRTLEEAPFSSRHVLNFLHSGPPEDRQPDMPDFDWRDVFNLTDRVIRMLNQYGDVSFFRAAQIPPTGVLTRRIKLTEEEGRARRIPQNFSNRGGGEGMLFSTLR